MQIETLKIFCDLAELLSFSKTADKNFLSQSAVSQQLAQLEMAHKCQFVSRSKRPIELTREGRLFYRTAREIIDRYTQFQSELKALRTTTGARINVGAIFSIGMYTLSDYVKEFMLNYPKVNVHIEYIEARQIYQRVLTGDLDIGIVAVPKKDKKLDVYEFEQEPLVLVCSPRHILAGEKQIDIHDVLFERFIAFEEGLATRALIDSYLQRYNIAVRPAMEFDNTETIKKAVEINSGISILPETTIAAEVANRTIKSIKITNEKFVRPTGIILRKNKIRSQALRYFIELLQRKV